MAGRGRLSSKARSGDRAIHRIVAASFLNDTITNLLLRRLSRALTGDDAASEAE